MAAEGSDTAEPAGAHPSGAEPNDIEQAAGGEQAAPTEDLKARFREALDRKKQAHHASAAAAEGGRSDKPQHESGAVGGRREFRRKAGG